MAVKLAGLFALRPTELKIKRILNGEQNIEDIDAYTLEQMVPMMVKADILQIHNMQRYVKNTDLSFYIDSH